MSCRVAMSSSPVFSPSRVSSLLFCITSSPERALTSPSFSPSRSSPFFSKNPSPERSQCPSSPLGLIRLQKPSESVILSPPKRKRPAMLQIPVDLNFPVSFPVAGELVVERREFLEVDCEEEGYSVYCKRGRREIMEDRFSAHVDFPGDAKEAFFGVFDGHGGDKAAEFAAKNLKKNILEEVKGKDNDAAIIEAVKSAYLKTDGEFLSEDLHGGTCSVTALLKDRHLIVSNAGDCRAVISKGGVAEALTSDHRPSRKDEKERIENLGGYVDCCRGVWRIQGSLAVSRGIGDCHLKQWVTAEPETKVLNVDPSFEFLILASDGLWDKISNQEAVDTAHPLCVGVQKPDMLSACKKLVALAVSKGSSDDITVMVIHLGRFS